MLKKILQRRSRKNSYQGGRNQKRKARSLRRHFEQLETRNLLAPLLDNAVSDPCKDFVDPLEENAACVQLHIAEDLSLDQLHANFDPINGGTLRDRTPLQQVSPDDFFRVEIYVQDLRTDDGVGGENFGVFAAYHDISYPEGFTIPEEPSIDGKSSIELPFAADFRNVNQFHPKNRNASDVSNGQDAEEFRYNNGLMGDLNTPGLINNFGSFTGEISPLGKDEFFQADIKFKVGSVIGRDDTAFVEEGSAVDINVLANDELLSGQQTFTIAHAETFGAPATGTEFLQYGVVPAGDGQPTSPNCPAGQDCPIVPSDRIAYLNATVEVVDAPDAPRTLAIQGFSQGANGGVVTDNGNGTLAYDPNGQGSGTDSFTYTLTDGQGNTQQVNVAVTIVGEGLLKDPQATRNGVAVHDQATGIGYLMYSEEPVQTRFNVSSALNSAEHFIAVQFFEGFWYADRNFESGGGQPFQERFFARSTDVLVAELDFTNDTVTDLKETSDTEFGIQKGYVDGDLAFAANIFAGNPNNGEFSVSGSFFVCHEPIVGDTESAGNLGLGVPTFENTSLPNNGLVGIGYVMYSVEDVYQRFSRSPPNLPNNARNFIFVKFFNGQWRYDTNSGSIPYRPFQPRTTDVLVAEIDLPKLNDDENNAIMDLKGQIGLVHGITYGYHDGDLTFAPNRYAGNPNLGEVQVGGTTFTRNPDFLSDREFLGEINSGIGIQDQNDPNYVPLPLRDVSGTGYIVFSEENLRTRFPGHPLLRHQLPHPYNSEHLAVIAFIEGRWWYDTNFRYEEFVPRPSDVLLAEVDLDANTITSLKGQMGHIEGITQGFEYGDINFRANRFAGRDNPGEVTVEGSYFVRNQPETSDRELLGFIGVGTTTQDMTAGTAYVMYSAENVFTRFAANPPFAEPFFGSAHHSIVVSYDNTTMQWRYDDNSNYHPFTPRATDLIIAEIDYGLGTDDLIDAIVDLKGTSGTLNGIETGYADGNLQFSPNAWKFDRLFQNDLTNNGELIVKGSWFRRNP